MGILSMLRDALAYDIPENEYEVEMRAEEIVENTVFDSREALLLSAKEYDWERHQIKRLLADTERGLRRTERSIRKKARELDDEEELIDATRKVLNGEG